MAMARYREYTIVDDTLQRVRTAVDLNNSSVMRIRDVVPGGKDDQLELMIVGDRLLITDRNNILGDFSDNTTGTVVDVPLASIVSVEIALLEGDDQLSIDFTGAPPGLNLSVIVNGGGGHDTLTFSGPMLLDAGGFRTSGEVEDVFVNAAIAIQDGRIILHAVQSLEVNADISIATGTVQLTAGRDIFGNCSLIQAGNADVRLVSGTGIANVRVQTTGDVSLNGGSGGILGCSGEIAVRARTLTLVSGSSVGTALLFAGEVTHEEPFLTSVNTIQGTVGGMGLFLQNDRPLIDNVVLTDPPPLGIRHVCPGSKCQPSEGENAPQQNSANQLDVNDDGSVTPIDALAVVNYLNGAAAGVHSEGPSSSPVKLYVDVNGDWVASALDVLIIVNYLNWQIAVQAEGEEIAVSGFGTSHRLFNHAMIRREPAASASPLKGSWRDSHRLRRDRTAFRRAKVDVVSSQLPARSRQMTEEDNERTQSWESLLDELAEDTSSAVLRV